MISTAEQDSVGQNAHASSDPIGGGRDHVRFCWIGRRCNGQQVLVLLKEWDDRVADNAANGALTLVP